MIEPLVKLAGNLGAQTVVASVTPPARENSSARIEVLEATLPGAVGLAMDIPRVLRLMLLGAGLAAVAALALAAYADSAFDDERQRLQHQITERRASLRLAQNGAGNSAQALLAKRKQTSASAVMVLEQVSRVLPDGTYVTELRIEGDKVQIVGLTQDAPSLIRLLEQSPQFTRATFFAPTTRTQNEAGERFHIEAHITPYFGPGS
jgi:general secretion pathway protein L